jgi:uncharacterized protein YeaO (DUF488 family)
MRAIRVKRAYDPPARGDGRRVLVDRLWPRGLKREAAEIDLWLKEVAPSAELRRWFNHEPGRWNEFRKRYRAELEANAESVKTLRGVLRGARPVTLLFAAKDTERNNAVALRDYLSPRAGATARLRARIGKNRRFTTPYPT